MNRLSWLKKKVIDNTLDIFGALLGGAMFWISMACIFYFDAWTARLIGIFITIFVIYSFVKYLDRLYRR